MTKKELLKVLTAGLGVFKKDIFRNNLHYRQISDDTDTIAFFIEIRDLPEKGNERTKSKKISVYMKSHYTFVNQMICEYGTKMVYVRKYGTEPLKFGVHFDGKYELPVQEFHPFCHMQYDNSVLDDDLKEIHLNEIAEIKSACLKNIRVPTANMDLISTLIMLAADHIFMGTEKKEEFRKMLQVAHPVGQHNISSLYNGGPQANSFGASCWYCNK